MNNLGDDAIQTTQSYINKGAMLTSLALAYGLKSTIAKLQQADPKLIMGRVSLQKLMSHSKSIKPTEINKDDEVKFDSLCRKYGVMYNTVPDNDKTKVSIFYREEDAERIELAMNNMIKDVTENIKQIEEKALNTKEIEYLSGNGKTMYTQTFTNEKEFKEHIKADIDIGRPIKVNSITKDEIENIQNNFENILNELTEKNVSYDMILDNSIDGMAELTKIKSKAEEREPLKERIEKAKQEKAKAPKPKQELNKAQKMAIYKSLGGR